MDPLPRGTRVRIAAATTCVARPTARTAAIVLGVIDRHRTFAVRKIFWTCSALGVPRATRGAGGAALTGRERRDIDFVEGVELLDVRYLPILFARLDVGTAKSMAPQASTPRSVDPLLSNCRGPKCRGVTSPFWA